MKNVFTIALLAIALAFSVETQAQDFGGLDKSPMDGASFPSSYKVSDKTVKITYSRPQLKGRSISDLAPAGKVWRTGANEAPEITFYKDVTFGETAVSAGTYSLFTIPGEGEWIIILNKNLNQWGAYSYDKSADLVRVRGTATATEKLLEEFSIAFKEVEGGAHMLIGWGATRVTVPVMM